VRQTKFWDGGKSQNSWRRFEMGTPEAFIIWYFIFIITTMEWELG
jgi:hypothetical protein